MKKNKKIAIEEDVSLNANTGEINDEVSDDYNPEWNIEMINSLGVEETDNIDTIKVAVIDSGIDVTGNYIDNI